MSAITVEVWPTGPDASGLWRGCWRLTRNGLAIRGRFGVTSTSFESKEAARVAAGCMGKSDTRNVPDIPYRVGAVADEGRA